MKYLSKVDYENADPAAKEIFDMLKKKIGRVPNVYASMANSPTALKALLSFKQALSGGVLSAQEAEAVSLVCAEVNQCDYCLAAHTAIAKMAGIPAEDAKELRKGRSSDAKIDVLVKLAGEIVRTQGHPSEEKLKAFYKAGYNDAALAEVIANVAFNIFTNYFNHIADPEIDFPRVD
jgi:uncharacterized peroxidase-related enzyme